MERPTIGVRRFVFPDKLVDENARAYLEAGHVFSEWKGKNI